MNNSLSMRALFASLFFFTMRSPIQYRTFVFEKKSFDDAFSLEGQMAKVLSSFIRERELRKQFIKPLQKKMFPV